MLNAAESSLKSTGVSSPRSEVPSEDVSAMSHCCPQDAIVLRTWALCDYRTCWSRRPASVETPVERMGNRPEKTVPCWPLAAAAPAASDRAAGWSAATDRLSLPPLHEVRGAALVPTDAKLYSQGGQRDARATRGALPEPSIPNEVNSSVLARRAFLS